MKHLAAVLFLALLLAGGGRATQTRDAGAFDLAIYKAGWMDGKMAGYIESVGIEDFHQCVSRTNASAQECWNQQIKNATRDMAEWNAMSPAEKTKLYDSPRSHRWIDNLTGKGPADDMPRYIR